MGSLNVYVISWRNYEGLSKEDAKTACDGKRDCRVAGADIGAGYGCALFGIKKALRPNGGLIVF